MQGVLDALSARCLQGKISVSKGSYLKQLCPLHFLSSATGARHPPPLSVLLANLFVYYAGSSSASYVSLHSGRVRAHVWVLAQILPLLLKLILAMAIGILGKSPSWLVDIRSESTLGRPRPACPSDAESRKRNLLPRQAATENRN